MTSPEYENPYKTAVIEPEHVWGSMIYLVLMALIFSPYLFIIYFLVFPDRLAAFFAP